MTFSPEELEKEITEFLDETPEVVVEPEPAEPAAEPVAPAAQGMGPEPAAEPPAEPAKVEGEDPPPVQGPEPQASVPEPTVQTSEIDGLKAQIASMQKIIEDLSALRPAEPPKAEEAPVANGLAEVIDQMDFDEIMESKEKFGAFIVQAMETVGKGLLNHLMGGVPEVVNQHVDMRQMREQFYQAYPELSNVRQYVTTVATAVAREHEDWTIPQVLQETAVRAKAALNIQSVQTIPQSKPTTAPVFPGGTGTRMPMQNKSSLQAEIDDFLND